MLLPATPSAFSALFRAGEALFYCCGILLFLERKSRSLGSSRS
jgi:hypothetical protein